MMRKILRGGDDLLARFNVLRRKPKLVVLALHTLWGSSTDGASHVMHPQQELTLTGLETALENFRANGYRFISPQELVSGLQTDGHHCLLTFDDGYRNNLEALPLLRRFAAPMLLFVVPHHVETGESFWWDAVYRKGKAGGKSDAEIDHFIEAVKRKPARQLRSALADAGLTAADFRPVGDIDRPLNRAELIELAKDDLVTLGNHTWGHEILTRCTVEERIDSLLRTQRYLEEIAGYLPEWIAYPNGEYCRDFVRELTACGLIWGGTLRERSIGLPLPTAAAERLSLARFLLWENPDIDRECRRIQLDYSLLAEAKNLRRVCWSVNREGK